MTEKEVLEHGLNQEINFKKIEEKMQEKFQEIQKFDLFSLSENQIFGIEFALLGLKSF